MAVRARRRYIAAIYERGGASGTVWTTLVADLETPVSAFLKLGGGKLDELPAGIGGRRPRCAAATPSSGWSPI